MFDKFWYDETIIMWRFNIKAIFIEILTIVAIIGGFARIYILDVFHMPVFWIFSLLSAVYLINRYVFYPFCIDNNSDWGGRVKTVLPEYLSPENDFWLLSARTRMNNCLGGEDVVYQFFHLFWLPLIPFSCYASRGVQKHKQHNTNISYKVRLATSFESCWQEIVYIYLKYWSRTIILLLSFMLHFF